MGFLLPPWRSVVNRLGSGLPAYHGLVGVLEAWLGTRSAGLRLFLREGAGPAVEATQEQG